MKDYCAIKTVAMENRMDAGMAEIEAEKSDIYYISPFNAAIKRFFDIVLAVSGMIVFSPLYLVIWLMIKIEDHGPAIFSQERIGYKGKPFTIYKFRSMVTDAEKDGEAQLCHEDDDRLTKVGNFLRSHHLDELPQLWNVLKGDMSFVGPRPERECFISMILERNPDYRYLYRVRPGLFSEATLYNGYTDTMEKMLERLRMDLDWLRKQSVWLDARIVFLTVWSILSGKKF